LNSLKVQEFIIARKGVKMEMLGGNSVATYIVLARYTQQGVENIKDGPARLSAAKEAFEEMGGELKEFYLTMGRYDMIVVAEAPSGAIATKLALMIGSKGAIRTETLRAFPESEYLNIIADLP
jgi:uncharacterized protein with GYD domain